MTCNSYVPDYFSVEDILCSEERLSCRIEKELPGLGFLDPSSEAEDLKPGTSMELPVWLAQPMNMTQPPVLAADVPKIYKEGYREILEAGATSIVLSKWSPFYYELGMHLRRLRNRDAEKITESLLQTFKSRFRLVMDWAQNPVSDPMIGQQLPRLERDLFHIGRKSKLRLNEWLRSGTGSIAASEVAANLKKRKRVDYELD